MPKKVIQNLTLFYYATKLHDGYTIFDDDGGGKKYL
jgi:hypothetical protein